MVIHYIEVEMSAVAKRYVTHCVVDCVDIESDAPTAWIKTKTDKERDLLLANLPLLDEFKQIFRHRGYSEATLPKILFSFQSQETVDRDFKGNWYFTLR
ncbi:hypothetical protein [Paraburkholderia jirisanensis]